MKSLTIKKFIILLGVDFILLSNLCIAEIRLNKSEILRQSNECLNNSKKKSCEDLILQMEQIQLATFEQNRFKCQSSILGLQTELIEAYYFKKSKKNKNIMMLPYVIKNC